MQPGTVHAFQSPDGERWEELPVYHAADCLTENYALMRFGSDEPIPFECTCSVGYRNLSAHGHPLPLRTPLTVWPVGSVVRDRKVPMMFPLSPIPDDEHARSASTAARVGR